VSNPEKHGISRFVSWYSGCGGDMIITKGGFDVNQQKIGEFLKHLRKEQGLTQEQLAEAFYVSSRTVSRWETGSNMPDLEILIELADFYHVDIREIIDGERKSEIMDNETKDTLKKVAEYAVEEKELRRKPVYRATGWVAFFMLIVVLLFARETKGLLNGIVSNDVCGIIMAICLIVAVATLVFQILLGRGVFDKLIDRKARNRKNPC
jgi:transcriptional regulator with XRE-family HTH domain